MKTKPTKAYQDLAQKHKPRNLLPLGGSGAYGGAGPAAGPPVQRTGGDMPTTGAAAGSRGVGPLAPASSAGVRTSARLSARHSLTGGSQRTAAAGAETLARLADTAGAFGPVHLLSLVYPDAMGAEGIHRGATHAWPPPFRLPACLEQGRGCCLFRLMHGPHMGRPASR